MGDWWIPVTTTLAFFVMFMMLHWTVPMLVSKIFGKHHSEVFERLPDTYRTYWRRLVRSQVYYVYAGVVGVILITVEYRSVDELIFKYHRFIEVNLCVALSHWILAVVEDAGSLSLLSADIRHPLFVLAIGLIYMVHHAVTIFAFVFILSTHKLSSLGVFGLAFEVPVAIQSLREFSVMFGKYYDENESPWFVRLWIRDSSHQQGPTIYWFLFFVAVFICRLSPVGLFLYSVAFWQENLVKLSLGSRIAYYFLGGIFTVANPVYAMLQMIYCYKDYFMIEPVDGKTTSDDEDSKILEHDDIKLESGGGRKLSSQML